MEGVGALGKRIAVGVRAFDEDAESFRNARLLASFFPKVGDGLLEGQTNARFAVGVGVEIDDADFLLLAAARVDEKNGVAQIEFGFEGDEGATGIDEERLGVFMEGAAYASKTVNHNGHAHGDALAGAGHFLCGDGRKGDSKRGRRFLRGSRIVEGGDLHCFLRNALLWAVLAALKVPSLLKDLFEGFLAVGKGDPGVAIPERAPEPNGETPRHGSSLRLLMIPVRQMKGRKRVKRCKSKSKRLRAWGAASSSFCSLG